MATPGANASGARAMFDTPSGTATSSDGIASGRNACMTYVSSLSWPARAMEARARRSQRVGRAGVVMVIDPSASRLALRGARGGFGALDARGGLGRLGGAWMTPVRPFWQMNIAARAAA